MRQILLGVVLATLCSSTTFAEQQRGAAYLEFMGNGMLFCCTLNVDWMTSARVNVRVGAGVEILSANHEQQRSRLLMVNYLLGKDGKFLEVGGGVVNSNAPLTVEIGTPRRRGATLSLAYRTQKDGKSLRMSLIPLLPPFRGAGRPKIMFGISRGYAW